MATSNSNKVELLINRGDGTFDVSAAAVPYDTSLSAAPPTLAAGLSDAGHPGHFNIVTVDSTGTIAATPILAGGTLGQPVQVGALFIGIGSAVAGDFNHDGRLDFALATPSHFDPGSVTLLLGRSDGTFTAKPSISVGTGLQAIAAADLNGDGNLDLVVSHGKLTITTVNGSNNFVYGGGFDLLFGKGDGTFQAPVNLAPLLGLGSLAIADIDGDGHPDIAALRNVYYNGLSGTGVAVFLNNGDGSFGAPRIYDTGAPLSASDAPGLTTGVFTANGLPGLVVSTVTIFATEPLLYVIGNTRLSSAVVTDAPLAATSASIGAAVGVAFTAQVASFTDANRFATVDEFTISIAWGDGTSSAGTVSANGAGGFDVFGSHTYASAGAFAFTVTITDSEGSNASAAGTATIVTGQGTVVLGAAGVAIRGTEGASTGPVRVASLTDSNPNATAGQFTATITWGDGAPSTVGLVTANGRGGFDVNGAHTYAEEGNYAISVAINDGAGHSATANSKASIADAALHATAVPVIGTAAASTGAVTVATFTDDDPGGVVGDYSATIDWGDGSPATSGLIRTNLGGGFDVTSTGHTYVEEGSFTVSVTVRDVGGASATVAGNAQIADAALHASAAPIAGTARATTGLVKVATFTDDDPAGTAQDYSAAIDWGDGSPLSGGTIVANPSAGFDVVSTGHVYAKDGSYTFSVTVTDRGGGSTTAVGAANIADAALHTSVVPIFGTEGAPTGSVTIAGFLDDDPAGTAGSYRASIDWGDGSPVAAGTIVAKAGGVFDVTSAGHTYAEEGTYTLRVTIADDGGSHTTATGTASIADAALHLSAAPIAGTEGAPTGSIRVASFSDDDPAGAIGDYAASIDWGDGTPVTAGTLVAYLSGGFDITSDGHTYAEEGSYTVTVTISNSGGAAATDTSTAQIVDAALNVTAFAVSGTEGAPTGSLTVANFADPDPAAVASNYSAEIFWGDGTVSNATSITPNSAGGFDVNSDGHTYAEEGNGRVTVVVTDVGGAVGSDSADAVVADAPLHVSAVSLTANAGVATGNIRVASFTDDGPPVQASDYRASIDWGDGSARDTGLVLLNHNGGFDIISSGHTYAQQGSYTLSVNVVEGLGHATDDAGASVLGAGSGSLEAPTITAMADLAASTEVKGTGVAGTTVKLYDNSGSTPIATGLVGTDGTFDIATAARLGQGTHILTATVTDGGTTSDPSTPVTDIVQNVGTAAYSITTDISFTLASDEHYLTFLGTADLTGTGTDTKNIFTGNTGHNTFVGGSGDNDYFVRHSDDVITATLNPGHVNRVYADVSFTLPTNVQELVLLGSGNLTGTGNSLDNVIYSNSGRDIMIGGGGNDTFIVHDRADKVIAAADGGNNAVFADVSFALPDNIKTLVLLGSDNLTATGNNLGNTLYSNTGVDTLVGGTGTNTFVVHNSNDVVIASPDSPKNTVFADVSFTLPANVQQLVLFGAGNLTGTGNSLDNAISANSRQRCPVRQRRERHIPARPRTKHVDGGAGINIDRIYRDAAPTTGRRAFPAAGSQIVDKRDGSPDGTSTTSAVHLSSSRMGLSRPQRR